MSDIKLLLDRLLFLSVLFCLLLNVTAVFAVDADIQAPTMKEVAESQEATDKVMKELAEKPVSGPRDEFNRGTPRSSILAMAQLLRKGDYQKAVNYLDLRNLPFSHEKVDGSDLVRKLHIIAQRIMNVDLLEISDDPAGHKNDGLPGYRDRISTIKTKQGPVDILIQRVPRGDGVFVWKISNATVALIPQLYEEFGYGRIGDRLSTIFPHYVILGFEIWQLVMLAGLFVIGFVASFIVTFIISKILQRSNKLANSRAQKFVRGALRFFIMVVIARLMFDTISPSLYARAIYETRTLLTLAIYWVMLGIVDVIIYKFSQRMQRNGQEDAVVLLKPAATGIKLVIALITVLYWLDNLGYEVSTIVAGLGVGGIAVALAAQKSLENLIGSIMIYASQPVHVGDFCRFKNTVGTVEEIGLRSTKLRTLARTVVHIPNALFSSDEIENLTQRDKILYRTRLKLSHNTEPEKIRQLLSDIRNLLSTNEMVDEGSSRVRFLEFGDYAHELELFVYLKTSDYAEYLEGREVINLALIDILASVNVCLMLPAQITYLDKTCAELVTD